MEEQKKPHGIFICFASHTLDGSKLIWTGKIWACSKKVNEDTCLHSVRRVSAFSANELARLPKESFLIT